MNISLSGGKVDIFAENLDNTMAADEVTHFIARSVVIHGTDYAV